MLQLRIWKLVNWKVQVIDDCCCGRCEPEIYFDEDVHYTDVVGMRRVTQEAMGVLNELITTNQGNQ